MSKRYYRLCIDESDHDLKSFLYSSERPAHDIKEAIRYYMASHPPSKTTVEDEQKLMLIVNSGVKDFITIKDMYKILLDQGYKKITYQGFWYFIRKMYDRGFFDKKLIGKRYQFKIKE